MIRAIIVDDEELIRKGLKYTIDWHSLEIEIVGLADNGQSGLALIKQLKPDLVLTDIRMPFLNGLEMVELAQQEYDFKAIFLTSYQDFTYAKKAISLQAFEYLLKPIAEEELFKTLTEVKNSINSQQKELYFDKVQLSNQQKNQWIDDVSDNLYVKQTLAYIAENYQEKISSELLAEQLQVSVSYLSRTLKKELNKTFHDLLNTYRIQLAISLLGKQEYRMGEISDLCGFSDYKHFYKVFKKYMGINPTDFLRQKGIITQD